MLFEPPGINFHAVQCSLAPGHTTADERKRSRRFRLVRPVVLTPVGIFIIELPSNIRVRSRRARAATEKETRAASTSSPDRQRCRNIITWYWNRTRAGVCRSNQRGRPYFISVVLQSDERLPFGDRAIHKDDSTPSSTRAVRDTGDWLSG